MLAKFGSNPIPFGHVHMRHVYFSCLVRVHVHVWMYAYVCMCVSGRRWARVFGARARVRRWVRTQARMRLCVRVSECARARARARMDVCVCVCVCVRT